MKIKLVVFFILLTFLAGGFLISDAYLYYYGRSKYNLFQQTLPGNFEPLFWDRYYPGFVLTEDGFYRISPSNEYYKGDDTIHIARVMGYGFDKEKILVYVEDSIGKNHYITCSRDNPTKEIYPRYQCKVLDDDEKIDRNAYKWIDLEADLSRTNRLMLTRFLCGLCFVLGIVVGAVNLIKYLLRIFKNHYRKDFSAK